MANICYCNITYQCNNNCKHCISHNVKKRCERILTTDDYRFLKETFDIGEEDIWTISGGEPTLSPYFTDIINYCSKVSRHIIVYSNGRNIESLSPEIIDKIERIIIPIYGDEMLHNDYVGSPNAFKETISSMLKIIQRDKEKVDVKILLDSDGRTESLFKSSAWNELLENKHFSITRVLTPSFDTDSIKHVCERASKIIKELIAKHKDIRFYDLPFCMLDKELQDHLWVTYTDKKLIYNDNVICGSSERRYTLFSFHKPSDYFEKCVTCHYQRLCCKIMQNYFCPITNLYTTQITTE